MVTRERSDFATTFYKFAQILKIAREYRICAPLLILAHRKSEEYPETMKHFDSLFERFFIITFLTSHIVVSFLFVDLYPFTSMPMFSAKPTELFRFEVKASDGTSLPTSWFGMDQRDVANPSPRLGLALPPSLCDDLSVFIEKDEEAKKTLIIDSIRRGMADPHVQQYLSNANLSGPRELTISLERLFFDHTDEVVKNQQINSWTVPF